jgi:preprotein translocase subunit SecA
VITTEEGVAKVEQVLGIENLYDHAAVDFVHHLETALKAETLYKRDVDYLIDHGEVKIVDEFTGRVLEGRRYSEGLHQAIEAKEGVAIKEENQTLATITLQNYFRLYEKLAGMTGTAETEAAELAQIYNLEVLAIPTNVPVARLDQGDLVYKSEAGKFEAVIADVKERNDRGQPILLGTISIERSELLSRLLDKQGIKHEVLNAKQHAREAEIIAQAGRPGAVTVATNMAGRGVDIQLGGNPEGMARMELKKRGVTPNDPSYEALEEKLTDEFEEQIAPDKKAVIDAGGLYVVGTERHESRRIDNQLRGRSGRQGDPGESRFYLSLEDDLMRRFQGEWVASMMDRLRLPEDQPIEAKMVTKSIERAQRQVESQNFEIRKNVLKYDEVMNKQREVVYEWRRSILEGTAGEDLIEEWIEDALAGTVEAEFSDEMPRADWDWEELRKELDQFFSSTIDRDDFESGYTVADVVERVTSEGLTAYERRKDELGDLAKRVERSVMLSVIDNKWREHLSEMDYLRAGIGLRAMGQRDPLSEYQREGFDLFTEMVDSVKRDTVRYLYHVEVAQPKTQPQRVEAAPAGAGGAKEPVQSDKVGRNDPCPCGSGKKYKRCHGAAA